MGCQLRQKRAKAVLKQLPIARYCCLLPEPDFYYPDRDLIRVVFDPQRPSGIVGSGDLSSPEHVRRFRDPNRLFNEKLLFKNNFSGYENYCRILLRTAVTYEYSSPAVSYIRQTEMPLNIYEQ